MQSYFLISYKLNDIDIKWQAEMKYLGITLDKKFCGTDTCIKHSEALGKLLSVFQAEVHTIDIC